MADTFVPQVVEQSAESAYIQAFAIEPVTAGHAPFEFRFNSFSNDYAPGSLDVPDAGLYNHAMHIGFNVGRHNGGPVTAGAPGWFLGFEDRWPDIVGDNTTGPEFYLEYVSPDGTSVPSAVLRPLYFRLQNGWNNTPTNKSVTIQLDIGQGPDGSVAVWGGVQNGRELLEITQQQVFSLIPLSVLGSIQVTALTGDSSLLIKANAVGSKSTVTFQPDAGAVASWQLTADENGALYTFDTTNGRVHSCQIGGTADTLASTQFNSNVKVLGRIEVSGSVVGDSAAAKNLILRPGSASGVTYFGTYDMSAAVLEIGNNTMGFFNAAPVTKRTGVPVTAAGIHAALVQLGLIS